jgi:hypothetical protein
VSLEALSVRNNSLIALPDSIATLTALRLLNMSDNECAACLPAGEIVCRCAG